MWNDLLAIRAEADYRREQILRARGRVGTRRPVRHHRSAKTVGRET